MTALTVIGPTICAGCDRPLPRHSRGGRPRKWCSEECRRRTWDREHGRECACGAPIDAAKVRQGTTQCRKCFDADNERRVRERAERIAVMWADVASLKEIAATFGWTVGRTRMEFHRVRGRWPGLLPYRHPGYADKAQTGGES